MEETREVALAYYTNSTEEVKIAAKGFFNNIDKDKDGKISVEEFVEFLKEKFPMLKLKFADLDKDGNGFLDFEEFIVFYYIAKFRCYRCDVCGNPLNATFFTCRDCFKKKDAKDSYDICVGCYKEMKFNHEHKVFVDNHAMLRMSWKALKEKDKKKEKSKKGGGEFGRREESSPAISVIWDVQTSYVVIVNIIVLFYE
ncbi:hypothetical protein ACHQM5_014523 [Ranunculus cassubicifolius]